MKFELNISPTWSSTRQTSRAQIRKALHARTRDPQTLLPSNFHRGGNGYFSISHTRGLGGYFLAPVPSGFDIELQNRTVSERVFKRLTSPKERALGFSPLEAWVAKEAAFKALSAHRGLKTITEVRLLERRQRKRKQTIEFSFKHSNYKSLEAYGRGFIVPHCRFLLGFASILP
jgi:hypothetical protein